MLKWVHRLQFWGVSGKSLRKAPKPLLGCEYWQVFVCWLRGCSWVNEAQLKTQTTTSRSNNNDWCSCKFQNVKEVEFWGMPHIKAACRLCQATTTLTFHFICQVRSKAIHCARFSWESSFPGDILSSGTKATLFYSSFDLLGSSPRVERKGEAGQLWVYCSGNIAVLLKCQQGLVNHNDFMSASYFLPWFPALVENTCKKALAFA